MMSIIYNINFEYILFSLFSSLSIISSIMVISLSNAVHSVLFLIFLFCNVASLVLLLGAEFLSLMFLIIYVGAIAVLFLFVIMMLNIKIEHSNSFQYLSILPIGFLISSILIFQFLITVKINFFILDSMYNLIDWISWGVENFTNSNVKVLGLVLYTKYGFLFLLCSLILLVSMIGAIVLTVHQGGYIKKQRIDIQLSREFKKTIKFSSFY